MPNTDLFPFDTLEAQAAEPERWTPTPNNPGPGDDDEYNRIVDGGGGGGAPASTHLTVPKYSAATDRLAKIDLNTALQYGTAEGYPPLTSFIRQFAREVLHPGVPYRGGPEIIMTCGSTDGFAKTIELLSNQWAASKDDVRQKPAILCEHFMYTNVLEQSQSRGLTIVPVEMDRHGMLAEGPGGLADVLGNWDASKGKRPHLLYTVT